MSPVIWPAYDGSSVGKRSEESFKEERDALLKKDEIKEETPDKDKNLRAKNSRLISIRQKEINL